MLRGWELVNMGMEAAEMIKLVGTFPVRNQTAGLTLCLNGAKCHVDSAVVMLITMSH